MIREIRDRWDFPLNVLGMRMAQGESWDAVERVPTGFMAPMRVRKQVGAFHEPHIGGPVATR